MPRNLAASNMLYVRPMGCITIFKVLKPQNSRFLWTYAISTVAMIAIIILLSQLPLTTYNRCSFPVTELAVFPVISLVNIRRYGLPLPSPSNHTQLDKPFIIRLFLFIICVILSAM